MVGHAGLAYMAADMNIVSDAGVVTSGTYVMSYHIRLRKISTKERKTVSVMSVSPEYFDVLIIYYTLLIQVYDSSIQLRTYTYSEHTPGVLIHLRGVGIGERTAYISWMHSLPFCCTLCTASDKKRTGDVESLS